jgi:hypothetical protein
MFRFAIILCFFLETLFLSTAQAVTQTQFLPGNYSAMAYVRAQTPDGQQDQDAFTLFQMMNVPIQNSIMGPGKAIFTNSRDFNLICATAKGLCSIILNHSEHVKILPQQKTMIFAVVGVEADQLRALFDLKQDEFHFLSTDHKMRITAVPGAFEFLVNEGGVQ